MHRSLAAHGRPLRHRRRSYLGFPDIRFHSCACLISPSTRLPPRPPGGSLLGVSPPRGFGGSPSCSIGQRRGINGKATLVTDSDGRILSFPTGDESNFFQLRTTKGSAYFDRTKYITILEHMNSRTTVFLRPRRFGKSLTLTMLESFHDEKQKEEYDLLFKGLDVDRDVKEQKVRPGEYLVLTFDFSQVDRCPDLNRAAENLGNDITTKLIDFYEGNSRYFGEPSDELLARQIDWRYPISNLNSLVMLVHRRITEAMRSNDARHPLANVKGIYLMVDEYDAFSNEYMDPHRPEAWNGTPTESLLKGFWAAVKAAKKLKHGIKKIFITGVSPLSLVDNTSGFNISRNMSFKKELAGFCGLTRADITTALDKICQDGGITEGEIRGEVARHLAELTKYANGYHFCDYGQVEPVFNTNTCLGYLESVLKKERYSLEDLPNSEVSEPFLRMVASSPAALEDIQSALGTEPDGSFRRLKYGSVCHSFCLHDLGLDINASCPAWRGLILYFGGFTFDQESPDKYLKIPNLIAAQRFGRTILHRYRLLRTMGAAVCSLEATGDIKGVLAGYRQLMVERDVGWSDFEKNEETHRDLLRNTILENPGLTSRVEYQVTKTSGHMGRVDLVVSSRNHLIVMEFKVIRIDFLAVGNASGRFAKAKALKELEVGQVLELKFEEKDAHRQGMTIREWIERDVRPQLKDYVTSLEVKERIEERGLRAHLVLIVGSRQILIQDMDEDGAWIDGPMLV